MKPILFNTPMTQAIQEGRKTETRRVVKFQPGQNPAWTGYIPDGPVLYGSNNIPAAKAPYRPGDILWVRETWQFVPCCDCQAYVYNGCVETPVIYENRDSIGEGCFIYRADYPEPEHVCWRPSLHMPFGAARLFLRVTAVRVERLQDMVLADVLMEGIQEADSYEGTWDRWHNTWDSTIKPAGLPFCGWEANPWVWVVEFERISWEAARQEKCQP